MNIVGFKLINHVLGTNFVPKKMIFMEGGGVKQSIIVVENNNNLY